MICTDELIVIENNIKILLVPVMFQRNRITWTSLQLLIFFGQSGTGVDYMM